MLSIFIFAYFPSVYLLGWRERENILPFLWSCYWGLRVLFIFYIELLLQVSDWQIFFYQFLACLSIFPTAEVLGWWSPIYFMLCAFVVVLSNRLGLLPNLRSQSFSMFSFWCSIVLIFMFMSMIHFELHFVHAMR